MEENKAKMMKVIKIVSFVVILTMLRIGTSESLQPEGRWKQLGNILNGTITSEFLGSNVAMSSDGNTIAISNSFSARVYTYIPLSRHWVQLGTDISFASDNVYDYSITMSADGQTVAISLPNADTVNGLSSGIVQVYTYDRIRRKWMQVGDDINGEMELQLFGIPMAISADGTTIAISAVNYKNNNNDGNVRVFAFDSIDKVWSQVGNIIFPKEGFGGRQFITSIDISVNGKTIAIGVRDGSNGDDDPIYQYYIRVYTLNSITKLWTPMGRDIIGETAIDWFGYSIAMSGNGKTIAIGAIFNDGNGYDSGRVQVYSFNNRFGSWKQIGNNIDGEASDDFSGYSVAISDDGKTVAIGAINNDNPNGTNSGHVRVYSYITATRIWTQIGTDINGIKDGDQSGYSLAMSSDGSTIIIGAPYSNGLGELYNIGNARVYKYKPPQDCTVLWKLYNRQNNTIVASLVDGIMIRKPPPCGYANIEAYVPCAAHSTGYAITTELFDNLGKLYKRRTDTTSPYFLYGKYGNIKAGNYTIRAIVNSTSSPFTSFVTPYTKFTLLGACA